MSGDHQDSDIERAERARRRLRGFLIHLMTYFGAMVLLLPVNFILFPGRPWILLPLVGWAAPLALHAAWAMGLFEGARK